MQIVRRRSGGAAAMLHQRCYCDAARCGGVAAKRYVCFSDRLCCCCAAVRRQCGPGAARRCGAAVLPYSGAAWRCCTELMRLRCCSDPAIRRSGCAVERRRSCINAAAIGGVVSMLLCGCGAVRHHRCCHAVVPHSDAVRK